MGRIDNNETNSISGVERREEQIKIPALTTGGIQQVLVSNGRESGISRTTRGFTILPIDRAVVNHGLQLLSLILPSAEPRLPPGKSGQSASINPNLIMAANNARLPENSFTFYSGGWGYAQNASDSTAGTPAPASYHQIWLGLSPVIARKVSAPSNYRTMSAERVKVSGGGEGGANSGTKSILNLNDRVYSQENVGNLYSQVYLTLFERLKFRSGNSFISTGLALNLGNISFKTTYFIPNGLPNSIDSMLSTSLAWKVKDNLALSAYYAPIDRNSSRSTYGVSAAFKFGTEERSPSLVFNWSNNTIDFGQNQQGDRLSTNEHIFGLFLNFGSSQ